MKGTRKLKKLRSLFVVGLFASMFVTSAAGAAFAVNVNMLDCKEGYVAVSPNEDGSDATCEPEATVLYAESEPGVPVDPTPSPDCWVTSDGVDACARGGVLLGDPGVVLGGCAVLPGAVSAEPSEGGSSVDGSVGTTSSGVAEPAVGAPVVGEVADCVDPIAYNMVPALGAPETMDKSAMMTAANSAGSSGLGSNTLALAGVMVALGGAAAIGLTYRDRRTGRKEE